MTIEALYVLLFLHVLTSALWVGGGLFMTFIVRPSLEPLDPAVRRTVMERILAASDPFFLVVGWCAAITGAASGIGLGRVSEATAGATRWGWAIALGAFVTAALLTPGTLSMLRDSTRLLRGESLQRITGRPPLDPRPLARFGVVRRSGWLRSVGLVLALALMTLARLS